MKFKIVKRKIHDIPVLEITSKTSVDKPLPLAIYYHGWQTSKELVLTQGRKLASRGFRVCLPDAPNHGERHQTVSSVISLTFWNSIQGNLAEYEFIRDHYLAQSLTTEIFVGGVSMGGITTCALLTHHPEIKAAACIMGEPSPLSFRARTISRASERQIKLPSDYADLLAWQENYDLDGKPETLAGRPLYIWHGTEDWKIPIETVKNFVKKNAPKPYGANIKFEIGEGEGHLVQIAIMDKVADFLGGVIKVQNEKKSWKS
ncbi:MULTISPECIES: alpha/beta fold hydrolase [Listeria]|uniref:alpha/beta fold hydrolase n=1 Tax=Listeria TaxID=1637 RepID=UPI000B597265|nr:MULTISPECIES: alpha/beta fold hydrolase [Listeria]